MSKVFIGVGHGGSDPGAVGNGMRESDVNLEMALAMKAELERHGVTVGISRTRDEDDRLAEEIRECNAFAPDLAVEVHNNSGGGDGFECYINGHDRIARQLAERIEEEVKQIGQNSRGVKVSTRLGWVNRVKAPAVLCEGFFLDSQDSEEVKQIGQNSRGVKVSTRLGWVNRVKAPAVLCEGFFLDSQDSAAADTAAKRGRFGQAYARGVLAQLGVQTQQTAQSPEREKVRKRFSLDESTMGFLDTYRFAQALYQRLAETK